MVRIAACVALFASGIVASSTYPPLLHTGNSTGETKDIGGGIKVYHAYAPDKKTDAAVLFLTDVFGNALLENRLVADSYARAGYLVLMPDYFKGDPIGANLAGFDINSWRAKHPESEIDSIIEKTIVYARDTLKVKKIGAAGFCFGGPPTVRFLAAGKGVDAGFIAHPGPISTAQYQAIKGPLAIAAAETDNTFNTTTRHAAEATLIAQKATYQINLYSGVNHGFAIRADLKDRKQVFAKESAYIQLLRFFDEWLKGSSSGAASMKYVSNGREGELRDQRIPHDFEYSTGAY